MSHTASLVAVALCACAAQAETGDQLFKLLPDDGSLGDRFGYSVAISGTTAIVGATHDSDYGTASGSAYLFNTATGDQLFKLLPTDGAHYEFFGYSVAIDGATAVVGADEDGDNGALSGSAYLFDATTGAQLFKLLPTDGASYDRFGFSVAISGSTAVVGAPGDDDNGDASGSAYLFDTTTGTQIAKLLPDDGGFADNFGFSVAISGNIVIIGAAHDTAVGTQSGSAYLFDAITGAQLRKLLPTDGASYDSFGACVAISGSTVIVGAPTDDDNGDASGSAYLFDAATGAQINKLLPAAGAAMDDFGCSVGISGATAIVGAYHDDDNGDSSGAAYLFKTNTGMQIAKLLPTDGAAADDFGYAVAISGTTTIVGAHQDGDNGNLSGSVYLFDASDPPCVSADLTTQGAPPGSPLYGVPDGLVTAADLQYYVNLWVVGCP